MTDSMIRCKRVWAVLCLLSLLVLAACSDATGREEGISRPEVEEIVQTAVAAVPEPEEVVTSEQVERIAREVVASVPSRSDPAGYTQFLVDNAISRYESDGLDATLAHYNRKESVDGQWYVFIVDEEGRLIGHYDPERRGLDVHGWVGTDANGYNFGPEMLSATREGKWVSYVYRNPETGEPGSDLELKNVWAVRRDGLLFASGWYIEADAFTRKLVSVAVDRYRTGGLEATVEYFASPGSALAGLESAIAYYNSAETVDGKWSAFIANENGEVLAHSDSTLVGGDIREMIDTSTLVATPEGNWSTTGSQRFWVMDYEGLVFGSGWQADEPG